MFTEIMIIVSIVFSVILLIMIITNGILISKWGDKIIELGNHDRDYMKYIGLCEVLTGEMGKLGERITTIENDLASLLTAIEVRGKQIKELHENLQNYIGVVESAVFEHTHKLEERINAIENP